MPAPSVSLRRKTSALPRRTHIASMVSIVGPAGMRRQPPPRTQRCPIKTDVRLDRARRTPRSRRPPP
jgi:hypothetical protein